MSHFAMSQRGHPLPKFGPILRIGMVTLMIVLYGDLLQADAPVDRVPGQTTVGTQNRESSQNSRAISNYNWTINSTVEGRTLIATDPTDPVNYIRASLAAYNQGNLNDAVKTLEEGRRDALPSALLLLALGALYEELNQMAAAEEATQAAVKLEPENIDAHVQLGDIAYVTGMYQNAAGYFRFALDLETNHPTAQQGLLYSMIAQGLSQEAEYECRIFLTEDVGRADLWLALGEAQEHQQKLREAFSSYGQALVCDPQYAAAHSRRGRLYCRFGQFEAAATECRAALALDPNDPIAHAFLGIACSRLGLHEEAREHSQQADEAGLHMKSAWDQLGQ